MVAKAVTDKLIEAVFSVTWIIKQRATDTITASVLLADCVTTGYGLKNGVHCGL